MISSTLRAKNPWVAYTAPFLTFLACLFVFPLLPIPPVSQAALWLLLMGAVCLKCFPREISLRPRHWLFSTLIGIGVFFVWIAPDSLIPGYRQAVLFSNGIVGHAHPSIHPDALRNPMFLFLRTLRAVVIVPIVEELFWRGWLMRWVIDNEFWKMPLGAYRPLAFWITAILFASEHGPYWDVGLLAGIIYNAWMVRSKSLADCIWMHAVTNAALCAYVIAAKQWQYWQ
jgi:hypothetical protein